MGECELPPDAAVAAGEVLGVWQDFGVFESGYPFWGFAPVVVIVTFGGLQGACFVRGEDLGGLGFISGDAVEFFIDDVLVGEDEPEFGVDVLDVCFAVFALDEFDVWVLVDDFFCGDLLGTFVLGVVFPGG